jgi:MATE family multidrug resistance protein
MKKYGRFAAPARSGAQQHPEERIDAAGRGHGDQRAVLAIALPLMANNAVQIILSLTDTWFIGRISTPALASIAAVQWLIFAIVLVLGGVGAAVQTLVAQYQGAGHHRRAAQATWTALWATLSLAPVFVGVASAGHVILAPFGFDPQVESLAAQFWFPRVFGTAFGVAVSAMFGFFIGIGHARISLFVTVITALANTVFNQLFIFQLNLGIAGSGWATTAAQFCGLLLTVAVFLSKPYRSVYQSHLVWRPKLGRVLRQLRIGFPMGLLPAADLLAYSIFQMMQVRLGTAGGAATQIIMSLTFIPYIPAMGIASAGTTLVGQLIGAADTVRAMRMGTRVIMLTALCTGGIGALLELASPSLFRFFASAQDTQAASAVALAVKLLWLAAAYQLFDGLTLGSTLCLRGAGDVIVPVAMALAVSWLLFVPLAHSLTFAPGQGWVHVLPQFGWGTVGGWIALVLYRMVLGMGLFLRWRSGAWQQIRM